MTQENVATEEVQDQAQVENITLRELDQIAQVIDLASQRGAFRAGELSAVGALYTKLATFLASVQAQQEAARAEETAETDSAEEAASVEGA